MNLPKWTTLIVIAAIVFVGCPSSSLLPLAGDARLVGTWEGNNVFLGYHVFVRVAFDGSGNYTTYARVEEDGSAGSLGGRWYADPQRGYLDQVRTWTNPKIDNARGTVRGLYEITGDTLDEWNNPLDMDRPQTRESAYTHTVLKRVTSKESAVESGETETPGVAQELMEFFY